MTTATSSNDFVKRFYSLQHTKNYATFDGAERAALKLINTTKLTPGDVQVVIASECNRFIPTFHLRTPDATQYAAAFAMRGFYVYN